MDMEIPFRLAISGVISYLCRINVRIREIQTHDIKISTIDER
jgi:hypothetical protein